MKVSQPLLEWGIRNKSAFRVLLHLKVNSSGYVWWKDRRDIAKSMGVSERTLRRQVDKLKSMGWIGTDGKVLYLRSMKFIERMSGWDEDHTRVRHRISAGDLKDKSSLEVFLMTRLVSRFVKYKAKRKGGSHKRGSRDVSKPTALAADYLAKCVGTSRSNIQRMKSLAIKKGKLKAYKDGFVCTPQQAAIAKAVGEKVIFVRRFKYVDPSGKPGVKSTHVLPKPDRLLLTNL